MLRNLLLDLQMAQSQTVGNMTLVPLVTQTTEYSTIGDLRHLYLEQDQSYDTLVMATRSPYITIIPQGLVFITKERAQDRTLPSAHLVNLKKNCHAFCVQSSQAGLMQEAAIEQRQFRLLPAKVRSAALAKRNQPDFSALWEDLAAFNQQLDVPGDFLITFFRRYQKQLAQFVAEFEPVPFQRGALILINDELVGVEVMPNNSAFLALWEPLIRDCYGAEALLHSTTPAKIPVLLENVESLDELVGAVKDLAKQEQAWVVLNSNG